MKFSPLNRLRFSLGLYPEAIPYLSNRLTWAAMILFSIYVYGRIISYYVWGGQ